MRYPVFAYSLSWHPDDNPTSEHMFESAKQSLFSLGLEKHQTIIIQHTDTKHPHVHLLINKISSEDGRAHTVKQPKAKLREWANGYEREHGIRCEKPVLSPRSFIVS